MYCKSCGSKIEETAFFCRGCGAKVNGEENVNYTKKESTIKLNISKEETVGSLKAIFNGIKSPETSVEIFRESIKGIHNKILVIIAIILIPIINMATMKSVLLNLTVGFAKLTDKNLTSFEIGAGKAMMSKAYDEIIPYGDIFLYGILFSLMFLGLILGFMFLISKITKNNMDLDDGIRAITIPVLVMLASSISLPVALSIGITATLFVLGVLGTTFIITLYTGFKSLLNETKFIPYIVALAFMISYGVSYYIQFQIVIA